MSDLDVTVTGEVTSETPEPPKTLADLRAGLKEAAAKASEGREGPKASSDGGEKSSDQAKDGEESAKANSETPKTESDSKPSGSQDEDVSKTADALVELGKKERAIAKRAEKLKALEKELQDKAAAYAGLDPVKTARDAVKAASEKLKTATTDDERKAALRERASALATLAGEDITQEDIFELTQIVGGEKPALTIEQIRDLIVMKTARSAFSGFSPAALPSVPTALAISRRMASAMPSSRRGRYMRAVTLRWSMHCATDHPPEGGRQLNCSSVSAAASASR